MARDPLIVQAEIAALQAAIATGALRVHVDFPNGSGRDVTYRDLREMRAILAGLEDELLLVIGLVRSRQFYFQTGKGL